MPSLKLRVPCTQRPDLALMAVYLLRPRGKHNKGIPERMTTRLRSTAPSDNAQKQDNYRTRPAHVMGDGNLEPPAVSCQIGRLVFAVLRCRGILRPWMPGDGPRT